MDEVSTTIGYTVYRSIDGRTEFWRGRVNSGFTFTDVAAASGLHRYFVASVRPDGSLTDRQLCTPDIDPTDDEPTVTAPASCSVAVEEQNATTTWQTSNGAIGYRIYRSIDGGTEHWQGRVDDANEFTNTLRPNISYQYLVSAILPDGTATTRTPYGNPIQAE